MNNAKKSLERISIGIAIMFGIYWIYSVTVQPGLYCYGSLQATHANCREPLLFYTFLRSCAARCTDLPKLLLYSLFLQEHLPISLGVKKLLGLVSLYVVGLGLFLQIIKNLPSQKIKKQKVSFKTIFLCFLLQFTALLIFTIVVNIFNFVGITSSSTNIDGTSVYTIFMLLIFNPVIEEFVFRKTFADKLLQYGELFYMIASSFCFAIVHGVSLGIGQILYTFILGLIWSYLMVKTGKLIIVIIMHALSNLFGAIILQFLLKSSMMATGIYFLLLMVMGVIGGILFFFNREKIVLDGTQGLVRKSVLKDVFFNRGILICFVFTVFMMMIS